MLVEWATRFRDPIIDGDQLGRYLAMLTDVVTADAARRGTRRREPSDRAGHCNPRVVHAESEHRPRPPDGCAVVA
ncbi:hypothetical protein XAC3810_750011 [Xanthomonas citri pv. citri]|nr:hypothetical protein XAC9322_720011 [Xanthomonas citri pv. citri]CEJ47973.1 hypothetical protein XAB3213_4000012 [Xanthomonas citri pv. bilvae]CEE39929.1 hypothetical protein XAC1083_740011 [Xanthomonas citri pv. citri]CEE47375.1 hypothetical protein XAC3810_750011 [Xanthomonas citri pv. citri]CEE76515.1 hypothetical protein XACW160_730017 [Xanthomonas citri pv. citri]